MLCVNCRAVVRDGAWFCTECGNPVTRTCVACGGELEPGDRFCAKCGRPVPSPEPTLYARPSRPEGRLPL